MLTRSELDPCREQQNQSSDPNQRSLGELLVENQFVTANQIQRIRKLTLPMHWGTDSLNVSVVTGIFLNHFTRDAAIAAGREDRRLSS